ncbi:adenosine deaminase [Paroceanicella profunda]|uniref:adenosine deaminase n=1 Tax=Paroceanicella profunda TaxID=2579971 RepID=UPI001478B48F|nr:adenosine deaminase [Paroceanicella profunda]
MNAVARDWATLPKVELHLHLEGAAPPEFIRALAAEKGLNLGHIFAADGSYDWADFSEFLAVYEVATSVLQTPEDYTRLSEAVLRARAAEGVIYTEIFLAPQLCAADGSAWADVFAAIREGAARVPGIEARFIPIAVRHMGPDDALRVARIVADTPGASGFGLAGDERQYDVDAFAPAFALAREAGLGLTAHAGEICGPESVRATLDALSPARIGHGIAAARDPALMARLAEEGVVLEVCPGSNIALALCGSWAEHPVAALDRAGVGVTLSTDDPPYFHTSLAQEYAALNEAFGWSRKTFTRLNRLAMRAAFCDDATRTRMLERLGESA